MAPSFTIAIPVYERLFGFEEALDSALAVTGCTEILVADNHSSHNEYVKICLAKNDPRIRYVRHDKNYGVYGNQNLCAALATSEFIAFLGSDDIIAPNVYDRLLHAYEAMPDLDVFFGPFTVFYDSIADAWAEQTYLTGPVSSQKFLEDAVDYGMRFPVLFVVRREKMLRFPFITDPHSSNDLLWIYSNASALKLYVHSEPISYWRKYPEQNSAVYFNQMYDVFPYIYENIAVQLQKIGSRKARSANRRAARVILSFLINEGSKERWKKKLLEPEGMNNPFLVKAKEIADHNWLIKRILYSSGGQSYYRDIARVYRKIKPLEGI